MSSSTTPRKVLIVEDVPLDAEMMMYELQQAGLCSDSRRVSDRAALVDALRDFAPDVILSDFSLPNFDGLAALAIRQQLCPDTPFIIVSGSLGEERAVQILKAGATDYVLKHDLTRLAAAVERALAESDAARDRKRIARELDSERRLLSTVLASSTALVGLFDPQGRVVRINPAAAAACGIPETLAVGQRYADLFAAPDRADASHAAFARIIERRGGAAASLPPWRELNRLGRVILWSASLLDEPGSAGETIVLAGIDVTDQQQQEETKARLAAIVDSSDDAIMSKTLDGVITSWNHGAERTYGYSATEAVGMSAQLLSPPGHESHELQILDRVRRGESVNHFETTRRCKGGQDISVSLTISAMRDASGHVVGASEISRDISQQKRLEELRLRSFELEAENSRVVEANRLKSEFLANMSHELRTPLNAIIGFGQLLASADTMPLTLERSKAFADHIVKAGHHLLSLINEILNLAQIEAGKLTLSLESVAVMPVLDECRSMLEPLAVQRNIELRFPQGSDMHVHADRTRLKQVLLNLLSNAVKYNRDRGSVVVDCARPAPERIRISVRDTGVGMRSDQLQALFEPFNRLGQEAGGQEGTGIGLVVTKHLVELMGGEVGVTSTPGAGSVFWIELGWSSSALAALPVPLRPRAAANAPVGTVVTRSTVLCVEDNPASLHLIREALSFREDVQLLTASNGQAGVEMARRHLPDVILMDNNMPVLSGREAQAILRGDPKTAGIPIIAISANAMPGAIASGLAAGFFRYLTKPIELPELADALDSALRLAAERKAP